MGKTGDNISSENANWKFSGKMVNDFESHVSKSVPIYNRGHDLIIKLSDFFIKEDSLIYDLGCSTGKLLIDLAEHNKHKKKPKYIGVDIEKDMVRFAKNQQIKSKLSATKLKFLHEDIVKYKLDASDLIISYFTVQFIHPKHRQKLIDKIYESLNWGGAFLFFEKVRYNDARFQDIFTTLYNDYKLEMGYSAEEILNKTRSLKGVMEPFSTQGNLDMLSRAGFKDVSTVLTDICFKGFIAIK
jgi:tRNA (cmo5U34)-methyltransferase